jgi:hypothetical protein
MFGPSTTPRPTTPSRASVCLLRGLEGALRLGVVEREGPADALVEVGLRLRVARSYLEGQRAQVVVQRDFAARGLHRLRLEGFGLGLREDQFLQQGRTSGGGPQNAASSSSGSNSSLLPTPAAGVSANAPTAARASAMRKSFAFMGAPFAAQPN